MAHWFAFKVISFTYFLILCILEICSSYSTSLTCSVDSFSNNPRHRVHESSDLLCPIFSDDKLYMCIYVKNRFLDIESSNFICRQLLPLLMSGVTLICLRNMKHLVRDDSSRR